MKRLTAIFLAALTVTGVFACVAWAQSEPTWPDRTAMLHAAKFRYVEVVDAVEAAIRELPISVEKQQTVLNRIYEKLFPIVGTTDIPPAQKERLHEIGRALDKIGWEMTDVQVAAEGDIYQISIGSKE